MGDDVAATAEPDEAGDPDYDPFAEEPSPVTKASSPVPTASSDASAAIAAVGSAASLVSLVAERVALRRQISQSLNKESVDGPGLPLGFGQAPASVARKGSTEPALVTKAAAPMGPPPARSAPPDVKCAAPMPVALAPGPPPGLCPHAAMEPPPPPPASSLGLIGPPPPGPPPPPPEASEISAVSLSKASPSDPARVAVSKASPSDPTRVAASKATGMQSSKATASQSSKSASAVLSKSAGTGSLPMKAPPPLISAPSLLETLPVKAAPSHAHFANSSISSSLRPDVAAINVMDLPLPDSELPLPPLPTMLPPLPSFLPGSLLPVQLVPATPVLTTSVAGPKNHWLEHMSPQGVPYYFCERTGESRWVRPSGPDDVVVLANAAPAAPAAAASAPTAVSIKEQLGEPEIWESIGKSGWLRVETEKGYKYFFHKQTKKIAWECPKEIAKQVAELDGVLAPAPDPASAASAASASGSDAATRAADEEARSASGPAKEASEVANVEAPLTKAERKERHEEERKVSKEKQCLLNFKQMLLEKGVKGFDKFEKWMPKLIHDKRFTAVQGQKERKLLFDALVKRIDAERKKQAATTKKGGREAFRELLAEAEAKGLLDDRASDAALRAMERRYEDDSRWTAVAEKERERIVAEAVEQVAAKKQLEREKAQHAFRELARDKAHSGRTGDPPLPWAKARRKMEEDSRWQLVPSSERERLYEQVARELAEARRQLQRRQRREEDDVDAVRKRRRQDEAESSLRSIFAERVRVPFELTWDDVKDHLASWLRDVPLSEEAQERIWLEYQQNLTATRRDQVLSLLSNTPADVASPDMDFEEVLQVLSGDAAVAKMFSGLPRALLEGAWEDWRHQALQGAVEVCRKWLRSCEHFGDVDADNPPVGPALDMLLAKLATDVRFRRLAASPDEQRRLVMERLDELRESRARGRVGIDDEDMT